MKKSSFHPQQAQELAAAFAFHQVDYMFIGKSGAILLGYPSTTQDVEGCDRVAIARCVPRGI